MAIKIDGFRDPLALSLPLSPLEARKTKEEILALKVAISHLNRAWLSKGLKLEQKFSLSALSRIDEQEVDIDLIPHLEEEGQFRPVERDEFISLTKERQNGAIIPLQFSREVRGALKAMSEELDDFLKKEMTHSENQGEETLTF